MKVLALTSLLFLPLVAFAAPDAAVASALQKIETARANLAKAVQNVEKDPPSTADLDAGLAAVNALKEAIDTGAEHEQKDLDLAKAMLAARKELRTQREYVDQRRANVDVHNQRRAIDAALTRVTDGAKKLEDKAATPKEFEDAKAAVDALRKMVEEARPLGKKDPKFATYLAEADATLAKQGKAIDDRATLQSVDKLRAQLDERRKAMSAAMAPLAKTSTDAEFESADKAASAMSKVLEEGKALEPKDKTYRADADAARKELAQSKKRMDDLFSETGLTRLKAEIEPAHKDLIAAAKAVRARKPTADALAEAKTAAIVVRKLVEKFQAEASRSQALGQYVTQVKQTLSEVEGVLEQRSLDAARAEVAQAMKNVAGKAPTDEHFAEASSAVVVLEKTLETVHAKDPLMVQPVADAKAVIKESKTAIAARRIEVDVQRQKAKVEDARKKAAEINRNDLSTERLADAEASIKQIRVALDEGAELTKKDKEYAAYDREVKERITELNLKLENRKIVLASSGGRIVLTEATAAAKAKIDEAKKPEASDADLTAGAQSLEAVNKELEARAALEKQDKGYAEKAAKTRETLMRLSETLEFAKQARELRRQTVEALASGSTTADAAPSAKTLRAQKDQFDKALAQFKSCESTGSGLTRDNPALQSFPLFIDGRRMLAKDVIALCVQRSEATEKTLAQLKPLIAFDEGPKKSFESGKGLLAQSKDAEALKQFDECISSGSILQQRNPELKERKFDVAGGSTSLPELIQQCVGQRKTLKAKK